MHRPEEKMDEFEQQLTRAMKRVNAPETLAKFLAVAAEADEQRRQRGRSWFWMKPKSGGRIFVLPKPPAWIGGAIAAALVLGVFMGEQVHERAQQRKAAVARQQFETAMRVTDHALDQTRAQLQRVGLNFGD